jgi:SAM-dependent methyltransferase
MILGAAIHCRDAELAEMAQRMELGLQKSGSKARGCAAAKEYAKTEPRVRALKSGDSMDAYKDNLAYIHDVGFGDYARNSARGLLDILRRGGVTTGLVVDLGCGSGIWASELANAGYQILGIDISAAMIDIARARVPEADFNVGSLLRAKLPNCNAVTSLGECFNYLFDKKNSITHLSRLFRRIYAALKPGGLLIFDIAEPGRGKGPRQKHMEGPDWAVLVEVNEERHTNRLTRRITSFRKVGELYTRDEETHRLQLYSRSEVAKELRNVGFRVRTVNSYGDQPMIDGCVGFVARKPKTIA